MAQVVKQVKEYKSRSRLQRTWETFKRVFKTPSAKIGGVMFTIIVFSAVFAPVLAPYDPETMDLFNMYATPSWEHLCGTDAMGRDIFSRILYGGRYSLALAFFADIIGQAAGIILGCVAGYFGKRVENLIMRFCDVWSAIPSMLLTIILSSALGVGFVNTIIAMSIGGIPGGVRMTRAQILSERGKEYLEAAQSINCSASSIMFSHLLPNIISPMLVSTTMRFGGTITMAAGLSYLGFGIQPPTPEWGALLSDGTAVIRSYPHMILFPGIIIGLTVLSVNLMGDGLRDALDPKLRN